MKDVDKIYDQYITICEQYRSSWINRDRSKFEASISKDELDRISNIKKDWEDWQHKLQDLGFHYSMGGKIWEQDTRHGQYTIGRDSYDNKWYLSWAPGDYNPDYPEDSDIEYYSNFEDLLNNIDLQR